MERKDLNNGGSDLDEDGKNDGKALASGSSRRKVPASVYHNIGNQKS